MLRRLCQHDGYYVHYVHRKQQVNAPRRNIIFNPLRPVCVRMETLMGHTRYNDLDSTMLERLANTHVSFIMLPGAVSQPAR